jgi:hypothetical protein
MLFMRGGMPDETTFIRVNFAANGASEPGGHVSASMMILQLGWFGK